MDTDTPVETTPPKRRAPAKRSETDTRLAQWARMACAFRRIKIKDMADELELTPYTLSRWLHGARPINFDQCKVISDWGIFFGAPTPGNIWEWSQAEALVPSSPETGELVDTLPSSA